MTEVTRNNHFVPQFYLRQWSGDGRRVWSYRLLVENDRVPLWSHASIERLAMRRDLYTSVVSGAEMDDFERRLKTDFEDPVVPVFTKLDRDEELSAADWLHLARFFAAQDLRTAASLLDSLRRWQDEMPGVLTESLRESIRGLEDSSVRRPPPAEGPGAEALRKVFKVVVDEEAPAPPGMVQIRAEVTPGRSMWLASMELLLSGAAMRLEDHAWSIAEPAHGWRWITCDHPVLRLNYNGPEDYAFTGGWGNPGTDLILPLQSPRHLLFTQVGQDHGRRIRFSLPRTVEIQRLLCERAHREVYAANPARRVEWFRPRVVDPDWVRHDEEQWKHWHERQSVVEEAQDRGHRST